MWLITPTGFFSIVEKPEDRKRGTLTIRARVKSDLAALKVDVLPTLGTISQSTDTDYRYRATASRSDVAAALAAMVDKLDYANFKSAVATRQGPKRAHLYHDVWDVLYRMQGDPAFEAPSRPSVPIKARIPKADAYGGVIINDKGQVLLREPAGHFGGYAWTFPKGRPDPGETAEQTALREVLEESGQPARIVAALAEVFPGTTTTTAFFLMAPDGDPQGLDAETSAVCWASEQEARALIAKTKSNLGRKRDLAVLKAGFEAWRGRQE